MMARSTRLTWRRNGTNARTVQSVFEQRFGEAGAEETASYFSLGGQVEHSAPFRQELGVLIGVVPDDWASTTVGSLEILATRYTRTLAKARIPANIDTLRGFACLLVVAYHVIGPDVRSGLRLPAGSAWHYAIDSFEYVRMPMFTAFSGLLYAAIAANRDRFVPFIRRKAARILLPLVFATVVTWALRGVAYGQPSSLGAALLYGYQHLWYLDALMMMFLIVSVCDRVLGKHWAGWAFALGVIVLIRPFLPYVSLFAISNMLHIFPFFIFGMLLFRAPSLLSSRSILIGAGLIAGTLLALQQLQMQGVVDLAGSFVWLEYACAFAILVVSIRMTPKFTALEKLSAYSYTIYLWHPVANAIVRTFLIKVGIDAVWLLFVLGMFAAVIVPLAVHRVIVRYPKISVPFIGQ